MPVGAFRITVFHPGTGRGGGTDGTVNFNGQTAQADVTLSAQGTVEGFVYTASGMTVAKAKVTIKTGEMVGFRQAGWQIVLTSNLEGRFRASGIPAGRYVIEAIDETTNINGTAEGTITTEGEVVRTDVRLKATGTIYGTVLLADGVTPAAHAEVTVAGETYGRTAVADAEGTYSFSTVPIGSYTVIAKEQTGFDGGQSTGVISHEGQLSRVDIVFVGTGNVLGRVIRADGNPLGQGAALTLRRTGLLGNTFTAFSDLNGVFGFYGIPAGDFSITANIPGSLLGGAYSGRIAADGMTVADAVIVIEDSGEIYGKVLREDGVTAVKGALVTCSLVTPDQRPFTVYALSGSDGASR